MNNDTINPRYVSYAKAHGKTPEDMKEHDVTAWPGGSACGFILWMSKQKQEFFKVSPSSFIGSHVIHDQDAWDKFLQSVANKSVQN